MPEATKFTSFAFTLRPRDGITNADRDKFTAWAVKRSEYYSIVTEKLGSQRHVHAGLIFKVSVTRSNVCQLLKQLFSPSWSPEEIRVLFQGVKIMYNMDWIDNYLTKDDDTVLVAQCLPEAGHLESYFPSKPPPKERSPRCSIKFHELEKLWYEHVPTWKEKNAANCRHFLWDIMYNKRIYPMVEEDRKQIQLSRNLSRWLNKEDECSFDIQLFPGEKDA